MTQELSGNWNEELWSLLFSIGHPDLIAKQKRYQKQGRAPRCKLCLAPFGDLPAAGWSDENPGPSNRNPRYCSLCDVFIRSSPGGAKVKMAMVFADVRDSTKLSERLPLEEYVRLMNDFYRSATQIFVETDGFMMDIVGDQVFALYPPGFSGVSEKDAKLKESELTTARTATAARKAFNAAQMLVKAHKNAPANAFSFGTAVHTGDVYIGTIRGAEEGISDVRVWGAEVNKAARLCALAGAGEALISDTTLTTAGLDREFSDRRLVELKGFSQPVDVSVLA
jgi:adenylate cyclase